MPSWSSGWTACLAARSTSLRTPGPPTGSTCVRHDEDGAVAGRPRRRRARRPAGHRRGERHRDLPGRDRRGRGRRRRRSSSLLPRRPLGIREVTNPAAAQDWAAGRDARGGPDQRAAAGTHPGPGRLGRRPRGLRPRVRRRRAGPRRPASGTAGRSGCCVTVLGAGGGDARARASSRDLRAALDAGPRPGRRSTCCPANGRGSGSGSSSRTTRPTSGTPSLAAVLAALDAAFGAPARAVRDAGDACGGARGRPVRARCRGLHDAAAVPARRAAGPARGADAARRTPGARRRAAQPARSGRRPRCRRSCSRSPPGGVEIGVMVL